MSFLTEGAKNDTSAGASGGAGGDSGAAGEGTGAASSGAAAGGAAADTSWRATLPEDMRGNATLSKFNDVPSLAKSYVEMQALIGKKGVFPPGEKATPEQWKEFAKTIGQPEFDKFGVKLPEGKSVNQPLVDGFKKLAHESGLMPHQAQGVLDWFIGQEESAMGARKTAQAQASEAEQAGLKKEWGDGYDKQVALARLAVKEVGGDAFAAHLEKSGIGNDVNLIRVMAKVGALLGEDKIRGEGGGNFGQTPDEIKNEIGKIQNNLQGPYYDHKHPGHLSAVKTMEELYKKLYPEKS